MPFLIELIVFSISCCAMAYLSVDILIILYITSKIIVLLR